MKAIDVQVQTFTHEAMKFHADLDEIERQFLQAMGRKHPLPEIIQTQAHPQGLQAADRPGQRGAEHHRAPGGHEWPHPPQRD